MTTKNNPKTINFQELATDLQYVQKTLCDKLNKLGVPRHLTINALEKLDLISDIKLPNDFACLGVIPSINEKDEPKIVKPTLFSKDGEIWLFDSKITPYKKVEIIDSWLIGVGAYAQITIDDIEMIVNISGDNDYLSENKVFSISSKTHGELLPEMLTPPLTVNTPLKARMFEKDGVYEVINNQNIRATYHEKENDVDVETGLLVDVKIDDKTIIKNVICNSQLERLLEQNKLPFKFKIAEKIDISKNKDKSKMKIVIIDPNKKEIKVNLDELDLI